MHVPVKCADWSHVLLPRLQRHHWPPVLGGSAGCDVLFSIVHTSRRPRMSSRRRTSVCGGAHPPTSARWVSFSRTPLRCAAVAAVRTLDSFALMSAICSSSSISAGAPCGQRHASISRDGCRKALRVTRGLASVGRIQAVLQVCALATRRPSACPGIETAGKVHDEMMLWSTASKSELMSTKWSWFEDSVRHSQCRLPLRSACLGRLPLRQGFHSLRMWNCPSARFPRSRVGGKGREFRPRRSRGASPRCAFSLVVVGWSVSRGPKDPERFSHLAVVASPYPRTVRRDG